ncbi:hypothetical protein M885DRAFT_616973 [Pelagophyceae sp. CCMP2097]|nr:hypothetical protein M885DRAFT_616973 [Pelagophyceae sp. CCMP2097]
MPPKTATGGMEQSHVAHSVKRDGFAAKRARAVERVRDKGEAATGAHAKRAFGVANLGRSKKAAQRNADVKARKQVPYAVDRTEKDAPPPVVVAVVGPRHCGKSTLIRSLVKLYSKHNLSDIDGPITVVSGRDRRLTFIEVPDDVSAMIDVGKVADLVLLMIDASFGFEMMTFEFLTILQTHGFPKVCGVLTHLDRMKTNKALQKTKRSLKHRFWTDIYAGAKMFYIGGVLRSGKYPRNEMKQLALYVSRAKFRPLTWRNSHAYMIADRVDAVEEAKKAWDAPEEAVDTQAVVMYGYLRGAHLKAGTVMHIPGLGDFTPSEISVLDDPVPMVDEQPDGTLRKKAKTLLYAPMAQIGNLHYGDDDDVYIDLKTVAYSKNDALVRGTGDKGDEDEIREALGGETQLVRALHDVRVDGKLDDATLQMFGHGKAVKSSEFVPDAPESSDEDSDDDEEDDEAEESEADGLDLAGEEEYEELGADFFKGTILASARADLARRSASGFSDLGPAVYAASDEEDDDEAMDDEDDDDDDGLLFRRGAGRTTAKAKKAVRYDVDERDDDDDGPELDGPALLGAGDDYDQRLEALRSLFVPRDRAGLDDDEHGDFEELDLDADAMADGGVEGGASDDDGEDDQLTEREKNARLKEKSSAKMAALGGVDSVTKSNKADDEADDAYATEARRKIEVVRDRSRKEFATDKDRLKFEGFRNGLYVRIKFEGIPIEFLQHRCAKRPVLCCGLLPHEAASAASLVVARIRRHRWHAKVLKTRDPVIFSCGWRRFQSVPLYSLEDRAESRHKYLKYTPEHMHCAATFYAPAVPPNSAVLGFHTLRSNAKNFRVALLGTVLQSASASTVTKKLKLCGSPYKVERNTAFIDGMFTSALEAARFEGAQIKTVSGVRGTIKKAMREEAGDAAQAQKKGHHGAFRATFEDKILLSDIVICRIWVPVEPPKFCAPILSHLNKATYAAQESNKRNLGGADDREDDDDYDGSGDEEMDEGDDAEEEEEEEEDEGGDEDDALPMRTVAQVRRAERIPIPVNQDSIYDKTKIERPTKRQFAPHTISKKLAAALPFASKPKVIAKKSKKDGFLAKRSKPGPLSAPRERGEKQAGRLLQALSTIRNEKKDLRDATALRKRGEHVKKIEKRRALGAPKRKERAKEAHKKRGQDEARKRAKFNTGQAE